jgi:hypothetical protein
MILEIKGSIEYYAEAPLAHAETDRLEVSPFLQVQTRLSRLVDTAAAQPITRSPVVMQMGGSGSDRGKCIQ